MAGETSNDRFEGAKKLLDYGFANYSFTKLSADLKETRIAVDGGTEKAVAVEAADTVNILLPKSQKNEINRTTVWNKKITAPIEKGDVLGYVNVYSGKEQIGRIPITAKENVRKLTFGVAFGWILKGMFKL